MNLRGYQQRCHDAIFEAWKTHNSTLVVAATGCGKCLALGTPVLMFDGTIRRVEDIHAGELLMGPDSQPREVLSTCSGIEEMFQVTPKKGEPYTVNKSHVLSLKITKGARSRQEWTVNMPLENYISARNNFKHLAKGYRVPVHFDFKDTPLDPYFLGLWLGDGTSRSPEITTADPEIIEWLRSFARNRGLRFVVKPQRNNKSSVYALSGAKTGRSKTKGNPVRVALTQLGLICNKHVPMIYKANAIDIRLLLLAGLMDSDGHATRGGYDFVSVSKSIAEDTAYLCRSVGLAAYISPCKKRCANNGVVGNYFRVSISGNCCIIPCKVSRKQHPPRRQKKDVLLTGISVASVGYGRYFGFTLSGDGLFLLGDFTVTHNTVIFAHVIKTVSPKRVMVLAHRNELIVQAREKIIAVSGLDVEIEKADLYASQSLYHKMPVVVSSIQTQISGKPDKRRYLRFDPMDFGVLICDECVVAGTFIDGIPVENIKRGDSVTTHKGTGSVVRTFKNKSGPICNLDFEDGRSVICTLGHPVWTPDGFIFASNLTVGDMVLTITPHEELHHLRHTNEKQIMREPDLQVATFPKHDSKLLQKARRGNNEIQENQRNAPSGSSGACVNEIEGHGVETNDSKGERLWPYNPATSLSGGPRMGYGNRDCDLSVQNEWISNLLQSGCWKQGTESRGRGRWEFSQFDFEKETGREKRGVFAFTRVVGRQVYEPGSGSEFERLCPDGFVYNLEVSNGNTYFANGVLVHNCHHTASPSWKETISHYRKNPDLKVLGVTATPDRADEKALGQVFESVAFEYGILDAIKDGYLVDITQQFVQVASLDYSHVRTTAGDLNEGDLSKVMEMEENVQGLCQPSLEAIYGIAPKTLSAIPVPQWREYLCSLNKKPRRTIVFTVSVAQAEMCASVFGRAMDGVEWVCGTTSKEKRPAILERFSTGQTHVVINCGVLLEGFDNPGVELIVMGRPTKSRSLYVQAVGRSTRPLPGIVDGLETPEERHAAIAASPKPFCRIIDPVGNSGHHKLITCADILGGNMSEKVRESAVAKAIKEGKPVRMLVTMQNAEQELERKKQEAAELARKRAEARKAHLLAKNDYSIQDVDPFGASEKIPLNSISRDGRPFSERQLRIFRRAGYDPTQFGYKQGQAIIGKLLDEWFPDRRNRAA